MRSPWDCDGDDVHVLFPLEAPKPAWLLSVCSRDRNQRDFQYNSTQMYPWITSTLPPDGFMSWSIWMITDDYGCILFFQILRM